MRLGSFSWDIPPVVVLICDGQPFRAIAPCRFLGYYTTKKAEGQEKACTPDRGEAVLPLVEGKREGVDVWNGKVCYNLGILLKGWS
jgi:hypothetical protein